MPVDPRHTPRCKITCRCCWPSIVGRLVLNGGGTGVAVAAGDGAVWTYMSCKLRLPATAPPASFMRVCRAWDSRVTSLDGPCVQGFSSSRRTPALRSRLASGSFLLCTNLAFNQKATHDNRFFLTLLRNQKYLSTVLWNMAPNDTS